MFGTGPEGEARRAPRRAAAGQAVHRRARQPDPDRRGPRPLVGARARLPRRAHRDDADQQRGLQLHRVAGHRHRGPLAAARRPDGPHPPAAGRPADAPRLLPGLRGALRARSRPSTRTPSCSAMPARATCRGCSIAGLSPDAVDDPCYSVEAFCSITAETPIDAPDAATFLDRTTAFLNERVWGTLNATVIVDPRTARDPAVAPALDRAVDRLRYGTVALNYWSAGRVRDGHHALGRGARQPAQRIGSGTGFVHNPLMFERVEKTVHPGAVRRLAQAAVVLVPPTCPADDAGARPVRGRPAPVASAARRLGRAARLGQLGQGVDALKRRRSMHRSPGRRSVGGPAPGALAPGMACRGGRGWRARPPSRTPSRSPALRACAARPADLEHGVIEIADLDRLAVPVVRGPRRGPARPCSRPPPSRSGRRR